MLISNVSIEADSVLGQGGDGWQLGWGSEPIFKYILPNTKPNDYILDICCGSGRASHCFGLNGCHVTLWDHRDDILENATSQADTLGYEAETILADISQLNVIFAKRRFKAVLMLEALVHQHKSSAFRLIADACAVLERGGFLYVDAPSAEDPHYGYFARANEQVDRDTYLEWCACSGEEKLEPFCFFHPGELILLLKHLGMRIVFQASDLLEWHTLKTLAIAQKF